VKQEAFKMTTNSSVFPSRQVIATAVLAASNDLRQWVIKQRLTQSLMPSL